MRQVASQIVHLPAFIFTIKQTNCMIIHATLPQYNSHVNIHQKDVGKPVLKQKNTITRTFCVFVRDFYYIYISIYIVKNIFLGRFSDGWSTQSELSALKSL